MLIVGATDEMDTHTFAWYRDKLIGGNLNRRRRVMKKQQFILLGLLAVLITGMSSSAFAAITETKGSADFTWKYEFTSDLPNASDLDENSIGDFNVNGGGTLSGGILTMSSTIYNYYYAGWGDGSKLWDVITDLDYEHGVTVEMSVKVLAATQGTRGATGLFVMPDGTDIDGQLVIGKTTQSWGSSADFTVLGTGTFDNTNEFHAFRIALDPDTETYSVWRDTRLLGSGLLDSDTRDGLRRLVFGDVESGPSVNGDVEVDYVRFISGAYAPPPAIIETRDSADFTWKYEFTNEFPTVSDLDANGIGDFNELLEYGTSITMSDGQLHFTTFDTKAAYYYAGFGVGGKLWDVIYDLDYEHGVTLEMSVKVLAAAQGTLGTIGLGMMPDGTDIDGKLFIAKTTQYWELDPGTSTYQSLGTNTYDNTDGFHAFRIALHPDTETYSVWRDAELLASGLGDSDDRDGLRRLFFGNFADTLLKGAVDVEYVRFTSGFYAAPIPPAGTLILIQ